MISIIVKDGDRSIEYEQNVREDITSAATLNNDRKSYQSQEMLVQTIRDMVTELKRLSEDD